MKIRAILFDADGVMIFPYRFAQLLENQFGIKRGDTHKFFQGVFQDCLIGKADLVQVLPPYLAAWGWHGTENEFIRCWLKEDNAVDERMLDAVWSLRKAGYKCCLATNQEHYRADYMSDTMGFAKAFDELFFSCKLGTQKPDYVYYSTIERMLGLKGGEILFWDDYSVNVEAARELNWNAEIFLDYATFCDTMANYVTVELDKPS